MKENTYAGLPGTHSLLQHQEQDFMKDFNALRKNLKKDYSSLKKIRIALLGDSATQFLAQAIRGTGFDAGVDFELYEADYDQVDLQVYDRNSELYAFNPEFVIIFSSPEKLKKKFYQLTREKKQYFAENKSAWFSSITGTIAAHIPARVIVTNFAELDDAVFGSYANRVSSSWIWQVRALNVKLMELAVSHKNLFVADFAAMQARQGRAASFDPKMYLNADMVLSIDFLPHAAKQLSDIMLSLTGRFRKCLILDLDNTCWGGIIGDDGIENIQIGDLGVGKAFSQLQAWAKQLRERGIILAVCSKNDEKVAREPFEKHPDMVLRLEDIAVFVANWESKVDNIRTIQRVLNIGFDSMVFVDDNPFERNIVREHIPEMLVPEMPEDPADYLEHLQSLNLFETGSFSDEDEQRTQQYRQEAERSMAQQTFTSETDFLANLEMVSVVKGFDAFNTPRVAQLSQRSNQFNLRTVRYTEEDIRRIGTDGDYLPFTFTLTDRFGDNGLICVIILKKESLENFFIDTWFMSCRVLRRGMENFSLNTIVKYAKAAGARKLTGEYIPTSKNGMVKDHYASLGFHYENGLWVLDIEKYETRECYISPDYQAEIVH